MLPCPETLVVSQTTTQPSGLVFGRVGQRTFYQINQNYQIGVRTTIYAWLVETWIQDSMNGKIKVFCQKFLLWIHYDQPTLTSLFIISFICHWNHQDFNHGLLPRFQTLINHLQVSIGITKTHEGIGASEALRRLAVPFFVEATGDGRFRRFFVQGFW